MLRKVTKPICFRTPSLNLLESIVAEATDLYWRNSETAGEKNLERRRLSKNTLPTSFVLFDFLF